MFESGKKYMFSRTAFYDDMLKITNRKKVESHYMLVNLFDGTVFVGAGETRRDLYKDGYTLTVFPEWCIDGEVEFI